MSVKINVSNEDEGYIEYLVTHGDGSTGSADLRIMELDRGHHMEDVLKNHNIPYGALIAETFLYPHSSTSIHRLGIGSQVLEYVVLDAKARNVRAIYAQPNNLRSEEFFKKKDFKLGKHSNWYLLLD